MFDVTAAVGYLIASGVGAFIGSYARKKGENLATHEDVDKLVQQMSAVTQATKEIEAKISNDLWERQRKWDVKREALFETIKTLGTVQDALRTVYSTLQARAQSGNPDMPHWLDRQNEALEKWNRATIAYEAVKPLPALVCGKEVQEALANLDAVIAAIASQLFAGNPDFFVKSMALLVDKAKECNAAIRRELRVDDLTPRSNESSADQDRVRRVP